MGKEINLMANYPQTKRDLGKRLEEKSAEDRRIARQFGKEFFDGDRNTGYGGYNYHPRFWQPVIPDFQEYYHLGAGSRILDVGCGKGFMLHDFRELIPGIEVAGLDISAYAIENCHEGMSPFLQVADARELPFEDNSFDLVISVTTVHNLERTDCRQALQEIERVSRGHSFITVDAYRNEEEKRRMDAWNLTALTYMHVDEWKLFFDDAGYSGDYWWFIP
jgi:SAM-dependent methyltransferase